MNFDNELIDGACIKCKTVYFDTIGHCPKCGYPSQEHQNGVLFDEPEDDGTICVICKKYGINYKGDLI